MMVRYAVAGQMLIATSCALAQSPAEMTACIDQAAGVSTRMLECGKAEIDKWDARLNAAYRTLMQRDKGEQRARLQAEQRVWLDHHLSETRRLASAADSGSGAFMVSQNFELGDIADRTRTLEARIRSGGHPVSR